MTVPANNTTRLTPAQFADAVQGLEFNRPLDAVRTVLAVEVIASRLIDRPMFLRKLSTAVGTTGSGGTTSVDVKKNGVTVLNNVLATSNTDANGTKKVSTDFIDEDAQRCEAGDLIEIDVTTIATGSPAKVTATLDMDLRFDADEEKALLGP